MGLCSLGSALGYSDQLNEKPLTSMKLSCRCQEHAHARDVCCKGCEIHPSIVLYAILHCPVDLVTRPRSRGQADFLEGVGHPGVPRAVVVCPGLSGRKGMQAPASGGGPTRSGPKGGKGAKGGKDEDGANVQAVMRGTGCTDSERAAEVRFRCLTPLIRGLRPVQGSG